MLFTWLYCFLVFNHRTLLLKLFCRRNIFLIYMFIYFGSSSSPPKKKVVPRSFKFAPYLNIYELLIISFINLFFLQFFISYFRSLKRVQRKILLALTSNLVGRSSCWVSSRRQHTKWVVSHTFEAEQIYMTILHWLSQNSFHYHSISTCFTYHYFHF